MLVTVLMCSYVFICSCSLVQLKYVVHSVLRRLGAERDIPAVKLMLVFALAAGSSASVTLVLPIRSSNVPPPQGEIDYERCLAGVLTAIALERIQGTHPERDASLS